MLHGNIWCTDAHFISVSHLARQKNLEFSNAFVTSLKTIMEKILKTGREHIELAMIRPAVWEMSRRNFGKNC